MAGITTGPARDRIERALLGFDIREVVIPAERLWTRERRALFLLRESVSKPLSTDTMVWPSLFDPGGSPALQEERERLELPGTCPPSWIGANADLWDNLGDMRDFFRDNWIGAAPVHGVVGITWVSDRGFTEARTFGPYREPTTPSEVAPSWTLLGFDVSDGSLVSGLTNCGYTQDEVGALRSRWSPLLNGHHLFEDVTDALAFREAADARVREHAPFVVYGLHLIETVRPGPTG